MTLTIVVPTNLGLGSMRQVFSAAIANGKPQGRDIVLDFQNLRFIESAGVVVLSNLVEWLTLHGANISYRNCASSQSALSYLDDVGFFEAYWGKPLSPTAHNRPTTYPFRRLQCIDSHQWIDGNVFPWIASRLNVNPSTLNEFKACVREVFNNISDHSTLKVGCMHVQWHPNIRRVKLAISDFGIGIPAEVRRVANPQSDLHALQMATREGFSSKKPGKNMGAGLSYLIDNIVKRYKGWVEIHSGQAFITFNRVNTMGSGGLSFGLYPGTLVSMILPVANLVTDEDEMDKSPW